MGAATTATELEVGQQVKVTQWDPKRKVPQHLCGRVGVVQAIGRTRAKVLVSGGEIFEVPYGMLASAEKPVLQSKVGAKVMYCGHNGWFVADIFVVGSACVVKAPTNIRGETLIRGRNAEATHIVSDFPKAGCWAPERGFLVVPLSQVRELKKGEIDE